MAKAESNFKKHGVKFEAAIRVFFDPFAITEQDRIEDGEYRWRTLGLADDYLLLMVAHTVHEDEAGTEVNRLISARRATPKERKCYDKNRSVFA